MFDNSLNAASSNHNEDHAHLPQQVQISLLCGSCNLVTADSPSGIKSVMESGCCPNCGVAGEPAGKLSLSA